MFDRPERGERAILVHVSPGARRLAEEQQEFEALALAAGAEVAASVTRHLRSINPDF